MGGMKSPNPKRPGARNQQSLSDSDCDFRFRIDLMGVRSANVRNVRSGDVLQVVLLRNGEMRSVVCQTDQGEIVGALSAFPGLAQLIRCIEDGASYTAFVEKSTAQLCTVFVSRSKQ
jgi:hypothetical protein